MQWKKMGLIYAPKGNQIWAQNYTHLPTVEVIDEKIIRVYFAALDQYKFGRIGYVDLDIHDPKRILNVADEPVLDLGRLGTFDDCGVVPSCVIEKDNKKYLYYIGFQRMQKVPYMLFTGLAVNDGSSEKFERISSTPVLDRSNLDPFSRSAPYVLVENKVLKMWYWSCQKWTHEGKEARYNNVIKYATSSDGINWHDHDRICISPNFINEYAVGRPSVVNDAGIYKMWYSIRSFDKLYSIGYAESLDGITWVRKDSEVGIDKSTEGWDAQMICYPYVVDIKGKRYMFYNGNQHGATGFGYAILEF